MKLAFGEHHGQTVHDYVYDMGVIVIGKVF